MIIGICGKSGCGKSTLAKKIVELAKGKAVRLDIDKVGHKVLLLKEAKEELIDTFGKEILNDNKIDRKKLGKIVFNSPIWMDKLTDITWKYMQLEIDRFLSLNENKIVILDWALLPNFKYFEMCDIRVLLDVPYEVRLKRAMLRDNITKEDFDLRENASLDYNNNDFDYVLKDTDENLPKKIIKKIQ